LPGALLWPSLTEETLFRVLLYPHPTETASCRPAQALSSLALYIALHPINARLLRPAARGVFDAPAFLLLAGMLGGLNLGLYQRTGSVWPPVLTHWLTVAAWLYFGGKTQLRA
ncbi:MAG TPA: CPBP family glutamic-type intramembrane protease, partial [Trueperaceae bacterium]